jgi:hypothetical protein
MRRALVLVPALLTACAIGPTRGTQLYAGDRRPLEQVATLRGPVLQVDDQPVSAKQRSFELLPGCHVVVSGGSVGHGTDHDAWIAHLPPTVFAIRAQAGSTYNITFAIDPTLGRGPIGSGEVVVKERDRSGGLRAVPPVKTIADVETCKAWAPAP